MGKKDPFIEGVIFVTRKGNAFVSHEDYDEDIEVEAHKTGTALHGDTVKVLVYPRVQNRRQQGEVKEVLIRAKHRLVGTTVFEKGQTFFEADDRHIPLKFEIEKGDNIKPKEKVYVELLSWTDPKQKPKVRILENLGPKGNHEAETRAILLSHDIDTRFPAAVEKEAEDIKKAHKISTDERFDFRDRTTFTIDPVDAKDFDDALSLKELDKDWFEVGIHIADVSHFVRPGTALDQEAKARALSVYLVDRTIPMLPEILSNDLCSLNPNEEKYAFSAVFEMNLNGDVRKRTFGKSVIKSDKRFTYEDAQEVLNGKSELFKKELDILENIAQSLRKTKTAAGAIEFDTEEVKFELDKDKKPIRVYKKERLETMRMIEDFMLLANREVASFVSNKKNGKTLDTFVFRVHDVPNVEKIEELFSFLHALGYDVHANEKDLTPKDIQKILEQIENKPEAATIKTAILRSMAKATYTTTNIGHFGLAFEYYTHFTSPIRRYPDLMVHRLLDNFLKGVKEKKDIMVRFEQILRDATQKEISAMTAERDSIRMKQVEYMKDHVGETFDGVITGATEWGVYVEEKDSKAEGMIRLKDLSDDYFTFDPKSYSVIGTKTKKKFAIGDSVKVKLIGVNIDDRTIDWSLI